MRLVLEEYLKTLREKDELDLLLCDLLLLEGYTVFNRPRTGERQYGVDILAKKDGETFLFVVKQKDITRKSWDTGPDSVRQSLNDILDVYLRAMLPLDYLGRKIHIIIVTNGSLQAAVQPNWTGYQKNHSSYNNIPIVFELWNIDELVQRCARVAFDETLFDSNVQSLLRKTLYYMDEPDFSNTYFEKVVNWYIEQIGNEAEITARIKKIFVSFYTCVALMNHWAKELTRYKIAVDLSEFCLIKLWEYLYKKDYFEKDFLVEWLLRFVKLYEQNNELYIDEITQLSTIKYGIMNSNPIENRLIVLEIAGRISTYGLYSFFNGRVNKAQELTNLLITFLNNNPAFKYPVYDDNIIELSLIFLLLKHTGRKDLKDLIHIVIQGICAQYAELKIIPAPNDNFEEALNIQFNRGLPAYNASVLFGGLLEWTCVENMDADFKQINEIVSTFFKEMTCQTWQINNSEEEKLYSPYAAHIAGISVPLSEREDLSSLAEFIKIVNQKVSFSEFSFNKYSFTSIALISSRYFHFPVLPQFWRQFLIIH